MNPLLAVVAGGYLLFNSAASPRNAEKKFESALKQAFPAAQIDVAIKGKRGFDVINGKFKSVRVEMRDFQIGPTPDAPIFSGPAPAGPASAGPPLPVPAPVVPTVPHANPLPPNELSPAPGNEPPKPATSTKSTTPPMLTIMKTAAAQDRGHVGHAEIALKNFGLGPLRVTSLDATFENVTYDWKELKNGRALAIESAGAARATLVVPAASLEMALKARLTSIQNPRVSLQNGLVRITGTRAVPIVGTPLPVLFTGRPTTRGNEIRLEDTTLAIGGAPVPGLVVRTLLGEINPVFSVDKEGTWPYRVTLTRASAQNEALSLEAVLTFVPALKKVIGAAGNSR